MKYCWKMGASGPKEESLASLSQDHGGEWPGLVLLMIYMWIRLLEALAKQSYARSRVGITNSREAACGSMKYYCVSVQAVSWRTRSEIVTRGLTYNMWDQERGASNRYHNKSHRIPWLQILFKTFKNGLVCQTSSLSFSLAVFRVQLRLRYANLYILYREPKILIVSLDLLQPPLLIITMQSVPVNLDSVPYGMVPWAQNFTL